MLSRPSRLLDRHPPLFRGQSLHPAPASHLAGLRITRHQRGFTQFTRPVFPSPAAARMERAATPAFPRASHPADQEPTTHAEAGTGHQSTDLELHAEHHIGLILQSCSSLTTCDLVSHDELGERADVRRWRLLRLSKEQRGRCLVRVLS